MTTRLLAIALVAAAGCGGGISAPSARDGCYDVWAAVCGRYYQCYSPQQIAEIGLPPTAEGCAVQLGNAECDDFTDDECPGGAIFHPPVVPECTAAISVIDCTLIATAPDSAPVCGGVCGD